MAINVNYCECEPMNAVKKEQDCKRDYKALAEKFCDMLERDMRADYMTCKDVACLVTALIVWLSGGKADAFITERSDHPNICYSEYLMAKTLLRTENRYCSDDLHERIDQSRKCWKKWALEEE